MAEIEEIACQHCGNFFMPRDKRNKYCSDGCRYEVKKAQIKMNNKRAYEKLKKAKMKKRCLVCNKTFITCRSDIVTCSPFCQRQRTSEQRRERARLKKEEEMRLAALPKPKTLSQIESEARAMGMHYGAYVAHLERQRKEQKNVI